MTLPPWTVQDPFLEEHYGRMPVREIARRLGRSEQAVKGRAHRKGLKIKADWTDAEDDFLRAHYDEFTCAQLGRLLGRTAGAVKRQACQLGITKSNRKWEDHEVEFLEANYDRMTAAELGRVLGMTDRQVWNKASALGLRKRDPLSREAMGLLWEMRHMPDAVAFFSQEFCVGEPALRRLLEEMERDGGPPPL